MKSLADNKQKVRSGNAGPLDRGVFASRDICCGEIVERCPVIILMDDLGSTLKRYWFDWGGGKAIALGCGSLYNHHEKNNADFYRDYVHREIVIVATKSIKRGEQIFIDYGEPPVTNGDRQRAC